jgi:ribosome-associated toxin RatA of RatAB toxin-antitoxin module
MIFDRFRQKHDRHSEPEVASANPSLNTAGNGNLQKRQVYDTVDTNGVNRAGVRDAIIVPNANFHRCFQVVSDVERYPEFLSIYEKVELLSEEVKPQSNEKIRIARYTIHIPTFLQPFVKELYYSLRLVINESDTNATLEWEQIEGPKFAVSNTGKWNVYQQGKDVVMELEISLGYSFYLPKTIKNIIQNHILHDSLNNIQKRAIEVHKQPQQQ